MCRSSELMFMLTEFIGFLIKSSAFVEIFEHADSRSVRILTVASTLLLLNASSRESYMQVSLLL